jgi:hypothetical protein
MSAGVANDERHMAGGDRLKRCSTYIGERAWNFSALVFTIRDHFHSSNLPCQKVRESARVHKAAIPLKTMSLLNNSSLVRSIAASRSFGLLSQ